MVVCCGLNIYKPSHVFGTYITKTNLWSQAILSDWIRLEPSKAPPVRLITTSNLVDLAIFTAQCPQSVLRLDIDGVCRSHTRVAQVLGEIFQSPAALNLHAGTRMS